MGKSSVCVCVCVCVCVRLIQPLCVLAFCNGVLLEGHGYKWILRAINSRMNDTGKSTIVIVARRKGLDETTLLSAAVWVRLHIPGDVFAIVLAPGPNPASWEDTHWIHLSVFV